MITVKFSGGLGNQFFQYAAGRSVHMLCGENQAVQIEYQSKTHESHAERKVAINCYELCDSWMQEPVAEEYFDKHKTKKFIDKALCYCAIKLHGNDVFGAKVLNRFSWKLLNRLGVYNQRFFRHYPLIKSWSSDIYVTGMWHSVLYSEKILDILRNELRLKKEYYSPKLESAISKLEVDKAVCVHVRRGDYLTVNGYVVCSKEYFCRGMEYIRGKINTPLFYFFSDDIEWCKTNFLDKDIVFIDENNPDYIDFEIMRRCKHFIISNSTFSWWAAYLAEEDDKIVIAPNKWSEDISKEWLVNKNWIGMEP